MMCIGTGILSFLCASYRVLKILSGAGEHGMFLTIMASSIHIGRLVSI